jgi:hypothetical protein
MSLEEFLSYKNPKWNDNVHEGVSMPATTWLKYFEVAKANFERFGPDGPPVGETVYYFYPGLSDCIECIVSDSNVDVRCGIKMIELRGKHKPRTLLIESQIWWKSISAIDIFEDIT